MGHFPHPVDPLPDWVSANVCSPPPPPHNRSLLIGPFHNRAETKNKKNQATSHLLNDVTILLKIKVLAPFQHYIDVSYCTMM